MEQKPPLPLVQAFLICKQIFEDKRTGELVLAVPLNKLWIPHFPDEVRLSVFVQLTGGHGTYRIELQLRDQDDQVVWRRPAPDPIPYTDPLEPFRISAHDMMIRIPHPGKFQLIMQANGEDLAHHTLWVHLKDSGPPPKEKR